MMPVLEDVTLDAAILDGDCPCEYTHTRSSCSGSVTHRMDTCGGQRNTCSVGASIADYRLAKKISAGVACIGCHKPVAVCWEVRPV